MVYCYWASILHIKTQIFPDQVHPPPALPKTILTMYAVNFEISSYDKHLPYFHLISQ